MTNYEYRPVPRLPNFRNERQNVYTKIHETMSGYMVVQGDNQLYWGYSKDVARLVTNSMRTICY